MLDVHPPHEPVHGWRDFLLHLGTITIGLFIALMLEAGVEWLHHRHIVAEARENIRHEIEINHGQAAKNLEYLQADVDRMQANRDTIRQLRDRPKDFHSSLHFTMSWSSFNDSAWRSARDMGALTYMPVPEVQDYSDLYAQQELANREAINIFTRQAYAATPAFMADDIQHLAPEDLHDLLHETAATTIGLTTLEQILQQLDAQYKDTLSKR